jgi:uncharacterized membrane protein
MSMTSVALAGSVGVGSVGLGYALLKRDVSVPWLLSVVAVVMVGLALLPSAVPGSSLVDDVITDIGAVTVAVALGAVILLWWIVRARVVEDREKPSRIAESVRRRFKAFVTEWVTVTRLAVSGIIFVGFALLAEGGQLLGELGAWASEAPLVVTNLFTALIGFAAAFPLEVPVLGSLLAGAAPRELALLLLAVVVVGVAWREA